MYSYLFGHYYYKQEMVDMIEKVEDKRRVRRLEGKVMEITFAEELKNHMLGIEDTIIKPAVCGCKDCECKEECKKCDCCDCSHDKPISSRLRKSSL